MKFITKKSILSLALVMMAPMAANAATVHIDAKTNTSVNPVTLDLKAGTYNVNPFKDFTFTAWNAWDAVTGCDTAGENCSRGWVNNYSIQTPSSIIDIRTSDTDRFATPELALANALSTSFTLASDSTVKFYIADNYYNDNVGGMALSVSAVPVPAAALLFAPAVLGFVGLRRKVQKSVA